MHLRYIALVIGLVFCARGAAQPVMEPENRAVSDPREVVDPPMSWVCLNPDTRRYEALKAASIQQAQQAIGGDDSTSCREIPVALDPERVAYDLNTTDQR